VAGVALFALFFFLPGESPNSPGGSSFESGGNAQMGNIADRQGIEKPNMKDVGMPARKSHEGMKMQEMEGLAALAGLEAPGGLEAMEASEALEGMADLADPPAAAEAPPAD
jgi:hypothetical protein